jgi:hypothetical protein
VHRTNENKINKQVFAIINSLDRHLEITIEERLYEYFNKRYVTNRKKTSCPRNISNGYENIDEIPKINKALNALSFKISLFFKTRECLREIKNTTKSSTPTVPYSTSILKIMLNEKYVSSANF